jgi:endonuclease/exonuclease/phosphatase family metal-dependent hydrolase
MLARLRALIFNANLWQTIEVAILGLFFWQALRQLIGTLYQQSASVALITAYPTDTLDTSIAGYIDPGSLQSDIIALGALLILPVLSVFFLRWRWSLLAMAILMVVGRLALSQAFLTPIIASGLVVASGFAYLVVLTRWRLPRFAYFFILGLGAEQIVRAWGDTLDPTLSSDAIGILLPLAGIVLLSSLFTLRPKPESEQEQGLLTIWGSISIGALLFMQLSLLGLPNAIAGRADADYTLLVPLTIFATLAPLLPFVRVQARRLIAPFDPTTRGWLWFIAIAFFIIVGTRLPRLAIAGLGSFPLGAIALVLAQLGTSLLWWYLVRPRGETERNWGGLWTLFSVLILAILVLADLFTYEYAFVRDFASPLDFLNPVVPSLLRGFRGMGLGILLIATLIALTPMIQASNRIPWARGRESNLFPLFLITLFVAGGAILARPPFVNPVIGVSEMRVGTYNLHGGYSEFFDYELANNARAISQSGVAVVLLQEVDAGRLVSFGVDQSLWLARRLGMDRRFFPTIEGLRGLAVLSRAPIVFDDGVLLESLDQQTGMQRVQVLPSDRPITFYNTQLGLLLAGDSLEEQERNQRQQLNQILATIDTHIEVDYGGRVENVLMLLAGTFHNVPDSPLLQTLERTGFSDPFAGSNPNLTSTLVRQDRTGRIDYLWIWRQGLRWTGNGVIDNPASDHRLAFVNLQFGR